MGRFLKTHFSTKEIIFNLLLIITGSLLLAALSIRQVVSPERR